MNTFLAPNPKDRFVQIVSIPNKNAAGFFGMVGIALPPNEDGVFEVVSDTASIWCDEAMVADLAPPVGLKQVLARKVLAWRLRRRHRKLGRAYTRG